LIQKLETPADVAVSDAGTASATAAETKQPCELVKAETCQVGNVKWKTYKMYTQAVLCYMWIVLLVGIVLYQGLVVLEKLWIKWWGEVSGTAVMSVLALET